MKIKLAISLVLAFLAFLFITQNTDVVTVAFLFWSVQMSLVLLLLSMLGAGFIIGWLLNSYLRLVRNRRSSRAEIAAQREEQHEQGTPRQ